LTCDYFKNFLSYSTDLEPVFFYYSRTANARDCFEGGAEEWSASLKTISKHFPPLVLKNFRENYS